MFPATAGTRLKNMNKGVANRQEPCRSKQYDARGHHSGARASPSRNGKHGTGKSENDQSVGREEREGDRFRKGEEHQRFFFQSS